MNRTDRALLEQLLSGPLPVKDLVSVAPRSTVYARLKRLVGQGAVAKERGLYRLLPAGRDSLERASVPEPKFPCLPVEALGLLPTPGHQALGGLVLCARIARRDRLEEAHHATFLVLGPGLSWKTSFAHAAILMAGGDPDVQLLNMASETPGSLLVRRDARGKTTSKRGALDGSVVAFDELPRARPAVRKTAELIMHGTLRIAHESEQIELNAVPVVTGNPPVGETTLEGRSGLDPAILRRCIILFVEARQIPEEVIAEGDRILERIRALGPVELPTPPESEWDPSAEVLEALKACLASTSLLARVDVTLVATLARAATAFLERQDALAYVLSAYLTVTSSLGWVHADWRYRLAHSLGRGVPNTAQEHRAARPPSPRNPFDYDHTLEALAEVCERLALTPSEATEKLKSLEPLATLGVSAAMLAETLDGLMNAEGASQPEPVLAQRLREGLEFEAHLSREGARLSALKKSLQDARVVLAGVEAQARAEGFLPTEVVGLRKAQRALSALSATPESLAGVAALLPSVARTLRVPPEEAARLSLELFQALAQTADAESAEARRRQLRAMVTKLAGDTRAREAALAELAAFQEQAAGARSELAGLRQEVSKEQDRLAEVQAEAKRALLEIRQRERDLGACDERFARVRANHRRLAEDIRLSRDMTGFLAGRVAMEPQLAYLLADLAARRRPVPELSRRAREWLRHLLFAEIAEPTVGPTPRRSQPSSNGDKPIRNAK